MYRSCYVTHVSIAKSMCESYYQMTLMARRNVRVLSAKLPSCCSPFLKLQEHVRSSGGINNGVSRSLNAQREHVPSVAVTRAPSFEASIEGRPNPASSTHTFPPHSSDQAPQAPSRFRQCATDSSAARAILKAQTTLPERDARVPSTETAATVIDANAIRSFVTLRVAAVSSIVDRIAGNSYDRVRCDETASASDVSSTPSRSNEPRNFNSS